MKIKYLSILPVIAVFVLSGFSFANAQSNVFTQNLYYGLQNNSQVTQLQEFLTSQGLYSGPITGNYYFLTIGAVKAFQTQQSITPAAGYFGPSTIAAANKIADATVSASNNEAITETGTSTPSVTTASTTSQLQLAALLQQVALLQQQLRAQQSSTQALQQIASNTQSITTTPSQPSQSQAPSATFTANGARVITIPYNTAATISWSSTNANSCNISPSGWSGTSGNQSTGNLTTSQTYSLSCAGAGGSTSASITVNTLENTAIPSSVLMGWTICSNGSLCQVPQVFLKYCAHYNNCISVAPTTKQEVVSDAQSIINSLETIYPTGTTGMGLQEDSTLQQYLASLRQLISQSTSQTVMDTQPAAQQPPTPTPTSTPITQPPAIVVSLNASTNPPTACISDAARWGNALFTFALSETANKEDAKIASITINDSVSPSESSPSFQNLTLWDGAIEVASSSGPVPSGSGYAYTFTPLPISNYGGGSQQPPFFAYSIPQGGTLGLMLKGDLASSDSVSDRSAHTFSIVNASSIVASGASSGLPATIQLSSQNAPISNPQTIVSSSTYMSVYNQSVCTGQ